MTLAITAAIAGAWLAYGVWINTAAPRGQRGSAEEQLLIMVLAVPITIIGAIIGLKLLIAGKGEEDPL